MSRAYASVLSLASQRQFLHTCGSVYTDAVSFVTASCSMRLRLLFTRHRSRPLPKPGRFENAAKSGAFSKRYGFICSVNGETALIWVRLPAIMARNLHSSVQNGESCTKFSARTVTSHLATRKTRHQQTRHQYEISYYIKSKPNKIFSEA